MPARNPIPIGVKFGRLTILENGIKVPGSTFRKCRAICECGNETTAFEISVRHGHTRSCGCLQREYSRTGDGPLRHGHAKVGRHSGTYRAWSNMLTRCHNPKNKRWSRYGGRGISVCSAWHKFEAFLADMGPRPGPEYSIDRIDNDGHYEPGNCRWAIRRVQSENTSQVILVTVDGEQMGFTAACTAIGISAGAILNWMKRYGITRQEALDRAALNR